MKLNYPKSTNLQKACLHIWFRQIAKALNDSGMTIRQAIKANKIRLDVPWTEETVKMLFCERSYLPSMYPKVNSLKELNTEQITKLYEAMNHGIGQEFGISLPFPEKPNEQ